MARFKKGDIVENTETKGTLGYDHGIVCAVLGDELRVYWHYCDEVYSEDMNDPKLRILVESK